MLICVINLLGTDFCLTLGMLIATMTKWAESAFRETKVVLWLLEHVFGLLISFLQLYIYSTQRPTKSHRSVAIWTVQYTNAVIKTLFALGSVLSDITSTLYWPPLLSCPKVRQKSLNFILLSMIFLRFFSLCGTFYLYIISYIVRSFDTSTCRHGSNN